MCAALFGLAATFGVPTGCSDNPVLVGNDPAAHDAGAAEAPPDDASTLCGTLICGPRSYTLPGGGPTFYAVGCCVGKPTSMACGAYYAGACIELHQLGNQTTDCPTA